MTHTPEQRNAFALCGAKTKAGSPCRMFAGQGTSHVGVGRCFRHAGATPNHEKHAAKVVLEQRLHAEAEALSSEEAQPHRVLKELLAQTGGRLRWLDTELSREHSAEAARLFKQERQFLSWVAKMCSEVNVEGIEAAVMQSQVEQVAAMVKEAATLALGDTADVAALGAALRVLTLRHAGEDTAAAEAELAQLRERRAADREQRIADAARQEAERLSGLTLPPAEWLPEPEPEPSAAEPEPPQRSASPEPEPDHAEPVFTEHQGDVRRDDGDDPAFKKF